MGTKRFSKVVDWDKHIAPYRLVQFVAGVGSGKNHWVEHNLMKEKRVLLITSRKAKVKETSHKLDIASKLDLNALEERDLGLLFDDEARKYNSCVCNNSQIEAYWKTQFNPDDENTHLWRYFDVIVVDEAHSLATDASFSDAPFHLYSFLNYVFKQRCVKLIFMTATPNPILNIVHTSNRKDRKLWNFTKECINILPPQIDIDTQDNILTEIAEIYHNGGSKVIYFVNFVVSMKNIINKLSALGVPQNKIAVSYSKNRGNTSLSEEIRQSKTDVEAYLKTHEDLPKDIFMLITTSRNKEGINIDNPKVKWYMYVDSHYNDECNQMWGRARSGLEKFTINFSARQHPCVYCDDEPQYLMSCNGIDVATKTLEDWILKHKDELPAYKGSFKDMEYRYLYRCIKPIEERLDFVRYDVIKNEFVMYKEKIIGCRNHAISVGNFREYVKINLGLSSVIVQEPFPKLRVKIDKSVMEILTDKEKVDLHSVGILLKQLIDKNGWLNIPTMTGKDVNDLLEFLYKHGIKQLNGKIYKNVNTALKPFGYAVQKGHHKGDLGKIVLLTK